MEFEKLNSIIVDLRKENQMLRETNYELESRVSQVSGQFTEERVRIIFILDSSFEPRN